LSGELIFLKRRDDEFFKTVKQMLAHVCLLVNNTATHEYKGNGKYITVFNTITILHLSPPKIFLIKVQVVPSTSGNKESYTFTEFSLQPILERAIQ